MEIEIASTDIKIPEISEYSKRMIEILKPNDSNIKDAKIYPEIFGSDHCPVGLEIDL